MKRLILFFILSIILLPLFSQGIKEEEIAEIKDEILSISPNSHLNFPLKLYKEDLDVKNRILSIDTTSLSPSLLLKHTSKDGKAFIEYGSSYLYYSILIEDKKVELKISEEGSILYLDGKQVGEKTLLENMALFEGAFLSINEILSSPSDFITTEIKNYKGNNWKSELSWTLEEKLVEVKIEYKDENDSIWVIEGYMEKDKIKDTFTPLNIFTLPYFTLQSVEKDGEERDKRLW